MNTIERIYTEADDYGFRVPYDGSKKFYDDSAVKGYIDGAKSERNKVIEEAIQLLSLSSAAQFMPSQEAILKSLKV